MPDSKRLRAFPNRVILKFPPVATTTAGGLAIPETSQRRNEVGTVYDIGAPVGELAKAIYPLLDEGQEIPIRYGSGLMLWEKNDPEELRWMSDYRVYRIEELPVWIVETSGAELGDMLAELGVGA